MILIPVLIVLCIAIAAGLALTGHGSDADWTDWPREGEL